MISKSGLLSRNCKSPNIAVLERLSAFGVSTTISKVDLSSPIIDRSLSFKSHELVFFERISHSKGRYHTALDCEACDHVGALYGSTFWPSGYMHACQHKVCRKALSRNLAKYLSFVALPSCRHIIFIAACSFSFVSIPS
jgi:hypothetical protein